MKSDWFWDRQAGKYDEIENKRLGQLHLEVVKRTQKYLELDDTVLDFGCATGTLAGELAGKVKMIYGIDTSARMIAEAKRRAGERNIENINFAHATIFDGRFERETFDVVLAFGILHLLENPREAVIRINELLKPGGLLISSTAVLGEIEEWRAYLSAIFFVAGTLRILPRVRPIRIADVNGFMAAGNLEIIESSPLKDGQQDKQWAYFAVARKV